MSGIAENDLTPEPEPSSAPADVPPDTPAEPTEGSEPTAAEQAETAAAAAREAEAAATEANRAAKLAKADKRFASLTAKNAALLAEVEKLQKFVPKPEPGAEPTPEDRQREVEKRAVELVKAQRFNEEANRVAADGKKEFADFDQAMGTLWTTLGKFDPELVEAALEAGDAHKVLYKLAQDSDEAERIAGLSPGRMGAALAKLAAPEPAAAPVPPPPPPPQSKAPAPIAPLRRGGGNAEPRLDSESYEEFEKAFYKAREQAVR